MYYFERLVDENTPEEIGPTEPISGLGDKAYQQLATYVLEGDAMVVVTVFGQGSTTEEDVQHQQDLARLAIGRLP